MKRDVGVRGKASRSTWTERGVALALTTAIAMACGGRSVDTIDSSGGSDGESGGTGGAGGKGARGGKGGTDAVGGTGGTGASGGKGESGGKGASGGKGGTGASGGKGGTAGDAGEAAGGTGGGGRAGRGGSGPSSGRGGAGFGGVSGIGIAGRPNIAGGAGFSGNATGGVPSAGRGPTAGFGGIGNPCPGCDDNNPCTTDVCTGGQLCVHQFNIAACDDGNACTTGERCTEGVCGSGTPVNCDDDEQCTADSCSVMLGCTHDPTGYALDDIARSIPDSALDCGPPSSSAQAFAKLADTGTVQSVSVVVTIQHSWLGDLTLVLEHGGVSVLLLDREPGDGSYSSNLDGAYTFSDLGEPFKKLPNNTDVPMGTYAPSSPLAAFDGLAAGGDWTLTASDSCSDDTGVLLAFALRVSSTCNAGMMCTGVCGDGVCGCE